MAQTIMSNTGTNTNKNMRMGIIYTVGVGYVKITGMYGCRYDSYNTSGSPCTVYTNGGNGINIAGFPTIETSVIVIAPLLHTIKSEIFIISSIL